MLYAVNVLIGADETAESGNENPGGALIRGAILLVALSL